MGNCTPLTQDQQVGKIRGQYGDILKCPNGHWLAVYETSQCTRCATKSFEARAHVNCTTCHFGLCEHCFTKKFQRWERGLKNLQTEEITGLKKKLISELEGLIATREEANFDTVERLQEYLVKDALTHGWMRGSDLPTSLSDSLETRVGTLAKLCQKAYDRRSPMFT